MISLYESEKNTNMYVQCTYIAGGIFLHNLSPKCFKFSGLYLFLVVSWWEKSYISGFTIDFSMGEWMEIYWSSTIYLKIVLVGVKHVLIYENDWNSNIFWHRRSSPVPFFTSQASIGMIWCVRSTYLMKGKKFLSTRNHWEMQKSWVYALFLSPSVYMLKTLKLY